MGQQTIGQVSRDYGVSLRMLRYYEKEGLLESGRREGYAYRVYDEAALGRLRQIIILRRLRIPIRQIKAIFGNRSAVEAVDIFQKSIDEIDEEITALSTIRTILRQFVEELQEKASIHIELERLADATMLPLINSLSIQKHQIKESPSMETLSKASHVLSKLENVRIVYLPPMTLASAFYAGDQAPERAWQAIADFVRQRGLLTVKPDLRIFRIEHANATGESFGSECWVSVPEDFDVPAPLARKRFLGGQYAAHVLGDDGFPIYLGLQDWINESDRYQYDYDGNRSRTEPPMEEVDSFGGVNLDPEELLNVREVFEEPGAPMQFDALFPVKRYHLVQDAPVEIPGSREKCGFAASIVTWNKFRILGFSGIMGGDGPEGNPDGFEEAMIRDGRLDILNRYKKPGAPILGFGAMDMDSQMLGGWRWAVCLAESDITDVEGLMRHDPYVRCIDASRWLIFTYEKGEAFDDHQVCMKLGYTWNGIISGSFTVRPDGKIGRLAPEDAEARKSTMYCWYPVK